MALLDLIIKLRDKLHFHIVVAHVHHNIREESDEEAVVLTRIALFFSALDSDCILNRSIPNESKYRIALLSDEMYKELMTSKKEDTEGIPIRKILKNFID